MRPLLFLGAIGIAGAACSAREPREKPHAVVMRAEAPFAIGDAHGSASFDGAGWRVVLGWRSERARTFVAVALAHHA